MRDSATSLDRLHDLALPPEVSWWPLAPGWYAIILLALVLLLVLARRIWKNWQANAYRRAALRELTEARDCTSVAEIIRRTALVFAPRKEIAEKSGSAWVAWLSAHSPEAIPDEVRPLLTASVYGPPAEDIDVEMLRSFASRWITNHR